MVLVRVILLLSISWFLGALTNDPLRSLTATQLLESIDKELAAGRPQKAAELYQYFDRLLVDESVIKHSNKVIDSLKAQGTEIIATTDPHREPKQNELVIVYTNYQHSHNNLPYRNKIWRHPLYFKDLNHTRVEYDPAWESIGIIYILNLIDRKDRLQEMFAELSRMHAPLDRIYHYVAQRESVTGNRFYDAHLGATDNHAKVTSHFLTTQHKHGLIIEDDVTFTGDIEGNLQRLKLFFERNYDYEVCLLCANKHHERREFDDLLLLSNQQVSGCSCYLVSRKGAERANFYFRDGYEKLKATSDLRYARDVYWHEMMKDNKFFLFKTKFGYQRGNYSNITGGTFCYFD